MRGYSWGSVASVQGREARRVGTTQGGSGGPVFPLQDVHGAVGAGLRVLDLDVS